MNKESIGQRIRALRHSKKLTQAQLAKIAGVSSPAVTEWEKDSYQPKAASLDALANEFQVTSEYILTGKGQIHSLKERQSNTTTVTARKAAVLSWAQVSIFTNIESVDVSQVKEWIPISYDDCEKCFYLKVQGLSNYPNFHEGDYILVDPLAQHSDMQSGDMIIVRKLYDASFKKLVIETDGSQYLQALNPDFKPNIIPLDEDCIVIGQVVDCIRYVYRAKKRARKF